MLYCFSVFRDTISGDASVALGVVMQHGCCTVSLPVYLSSVTRAAVTLALLRGWS